MVTGEVQQLDEGIGHPVRTRSPVPLPILGGMGRGQR